MPCGPPKLWINSMPCSPRWAAPDVQQFGATIDDDLDTDSVPVLDDDAADRGAGAQRQILRPIAGLR
jgi:hypothetical protein